MGRGVRKRARALAADITARHPRRGRRTPARSDGRVGERVRWGRQLLGLTREQLAEPNYVPTYVSRIEAGQVRPSREALEHFATKLGFTSEELAFGMGDLSPSGAFRRAIMLIGHSLASAPDPSRGSLERDVAVALLRSGLERLERG